MTKHPLLYIRTFFLLSSQVQHSKGTHMQSLVFNSACMYLIDQNLQFLCFFDDQRVGFRV